MRTELLRAGPSPRQRPGASSKGYPKLLVYDFDKRLGGFTPIIEVN